MVHNYRVKQHNTLDPETLPTLKFGAFATFILATWGLCYLMYKKNQKIWLLLTVTTSRSKNRKFYC